MAVVSNGSAVLGLGNIGALAAKPVMEGKAVLFKKFADIDVFDIEIDESDPDALADTIRRLEPTFGAINLEDIKAPDCFVVENRLMAEMNIPVFHDDQHGTAIVVAAAIVSPARSETPGLSGVSRRTGCSDSLHCLLDDVQIYGLLQKLSFPGSNARRLAGSMAASWEGAGSGSAVLQALPLNTKFGRRESILGRCRIEFVKP